MEERNKHKLEKTGKQRENDGNIRDVDWFEMLLSAATSEDWEVTTGEGNTEVVWGSAGVDTVVGAFEGVSDEITEVVWGSVEIDIVAAVEGVSDPVEFSWFTTLFAIVESIKVVRGSAGEETVVGAYEGVSVENTEVVWGSVEVNSVVAAVEGVSDPVEFSWFTTLFAIVEVNKVVWGSAGVETVVGAFEGVSVEISEVVWGSVEIDIVAAVEGVSDPVEFSWFTTLFAIVENNKVVWGSAGVKTVVGAIEGVSVEITEVVWGSVEVDSVIAAVEGVSDPVEFSWFTTLFAIVEVIKVVWGSAGVDTVVGAFEGVSVEITEVVWGSVEVNSVVVAVEGVSDPVELSWFTTLFAIVEDI